MRKCIAYSKAKPTSKSYIMDDLPAHTVTPAKPFQNVGADYFDPACISESMKRRQQDVTKAYSVVHLYALQRK